MAVLGAGRSVRFGAAKLDRPCAGKSLGTWALDAALQRGGETVLVAREPAPAFAAGFGDRLTVLVNENAAAGLGTSVALAARHALARGAPMLILTLADMPLVTAALLDRLAGICPEGGAAACRHADGQPGIPAAWHGTYLPLLAAIAPDGGAKSLLRQVEPIRLVDTEPGLLSEVDVPDDLAAIEIAIASSLRR